MTAYCIFLQLSHYFTNNSFKIIKLIQKTTNTAHKTIVLCSTYNFSPIKSIYRSFIYNLIKNLQLVISL